LNTQKYRLPLKIFLLLFAEKSYSQYISPGVRIGYDFNSHTTIEWKVSVGFGLSESIANITLGKKYALNNKETYQAHNYLDFQLLGLSDTIGKRKTHLFYGGGIGLVFYDKDGIHKYCPRVTTFAGFFLFTTLDLYLDDENSVETDLGLQGVLPIPLVGVDFGSPGG